MTLALWPTPRTEHSVRVNGFSQNALLRATNGNVEADAIARYVSKCAMCLYAVSFFADYDCELNFVVGPAIGATDCDRLRRPITELVAFRKRPARSISAI